jgi:hypothetical protein
MEWKSPKASDGCTTYLCARLHRTWDVYVCQYMAHPWSIWRFSNCGTDAANMEALMGVFTNAFKSLKTTGVEAMFCDEIFAEAHPTLFAFLAFSHDDEGKPRTTSTLMIFIEGGVAKACLKERDHDRTLWASAPSLLEVFSSLEKRLNDSPVDWREPAASKHRR